VLDHPVFSRHRRRNCSPDRVTSGGVPARRRGLPA
jgi:hypothetical protein